MSHNSKRLYDRQKTEGFSGGFTLIELMLAMAFIAFILVFISLILVQMFRTYDKGTSMKQVNQAGRAIVDDIGQAIRSQLPANINTEHVNEGVLCIDKVMYVWNPLYTDDSATMVTDHRAVIGDPANGGMMARKVLQGSSCPTDYVDASSALVDTTKSVQLLTGQTRVISSKVSRVSNQSRLLKLEFTIGTYGRDEVVGNTTKYVTPTRSTDGGDISCLAGDDGNYCSFAEFNTVVYITGGQ